MSSKKTVGEEALLLQKQGPMDTDAIELQREIQKGSNSKKSYEEEVSEAVARGKADAQIEGDFYIIVLFKKERHLQNVVRQLFFYRQSCPTPEFDQTVYKYHRDQDKLEFLWVVPNNAACQFIPTIIGELPREQQELREMVMAFNSGELDKKARLLNGEFEKV